MTRLFDGDMFGFAPPLIITEDQVDEMVSIFGDTVAAIRRGDDQA